MSVTGDVRALMARGVEPVAMQRLLRHKVTPGGLRRIMSQLRREADCPLTAHVSARVSRPVKDKLLAEAERRGLPPNALIAELLTDAARRGFSTSVQDQGRAS